MSCYEASKVNKLELSKNLKPLAFKQFMNGIDLMTKYETIAPFIYIEKLRPW